ncbi:MAG: 4Fe-4S binding protein [Candidatus Marinimicrobia bacterium]|nr:4Fe-4S binding protein [Candidatus Neomarinimicrobiota bacterium]
MKVWFSLLSKNQKIWMVVTIAVCLCIVLIGFVFEQSNEAEAIEIKLDMSLKSAAIKLDITGKSIARELSLPLDIKKSQSFRELGVTKEQLDNAGHHIQSHSPKKVKYYIFVSLTLFGLVFLTRIGRPDGTSAKKDRYLWYPRVFYIITLLLAVLFAGFALGKSPNPIESFVKVFKSMVGLYPDPVNKVLVFVFFSVLAILGNKLICGWACPFGALQELLYDNCLTRKIPRFKVPFIISNTIRSLLFITMIVLLFGIIGGKKGYVIYHYVNPFNLFNFDFDELSIIVTLVGVFIAGLFIYRPFCQFICPFGLISWFVERLSIFHVKIDHSRCTECGVCIDVCPLDAAKGLVEKKRIPADCFSCARCLNVCPVDAIHYEFRKDLANVSSK